MSDDEAEYSVWWWDPEGNCHPERRWITGGEAVELAHAMTQRPAARLGIFKRIIITDGGDCTVFEWKHGEGVTFPTKEERDAHARANPR